MLPLAGALLILGIFVAVAAAYRIPFWNPTYFFAVAFGIQLALGLALADRLSIEYTREFALPLATATVVSVGLLLVLSLRHLELIRDRRDLSGQLRRILVTPGAYRVLSVSLFLIALHNTVVNGILIAKWKTLPVLAFAKYKGEVARSIGGVAIPFDIVSQFSVPFFSMLARSLVNPAVVIYFVLVFGNRVWARKARRHARAVPYEALIHLSFALILFESASSHRRNPLVIGLFTLFLLLFVYQRISRGWMTAAALALVVATIGIGQFRRGTGEFRAAEALGLPSIAGNTMIYEPLVYLSAGVPNFYLYWRLDTEHGRGKLLLSSLLPRPLDEALGVSMSRNDLLRDLARSGFSLPGQTLSTGWFEAYYEFGFGGVLVLSVLFPLGVFWLYRRALGPGRSSPPGLEYFVLLKPILFFPLVNVLLQLPFHVAALSAVGITVAMGRSMRQARRRGFEPGSPAAVALAGIPRSTRMSP